MKIKKINVEQAKKLFYLLFEIIEDDRIDLNIRQEYLERVSQLAYGKKDS